MELKNHVAVNIKSARESFLQANNSGLNVHDNLKGLSVCELKLLTERNTFPFWVCCLNVLSDMNISTVIRSAHLMGAERVIVFGRRKIDNRGLVGAANYTPVEKIWGIDCNAELNADHFWQFCRQRNVKPIFVEQGGTNLFQFDWLRHIQLINSVGCKPMLTLGTENSGIPDEILSMNKALTAEIVSIPQSGVIRSHNVSMAFGIVASQMIAGMNWY